jgi:hypothetical protein
MRKKIAVDVGLVAVSAVVTVWHAEPAEPALRVGMNGKQVDSIIGTPRTGTHRRTQPNPDNPAKEVNVERVATW